MPTEESVAKRLPLSPDKSHVLGETEMWLLKRIVNSPHERVDLSRFKMPRHRTAVRNLLQRGLLQKVGIRRDLKTEELRIADLIQLMKGRAPSEFYEQATGGVKPIFIALGSTRAKLIRKVLKRRPN